MNARKVIGPLTFSLSSKKRIFKTKEWEIHGINMHKVSIDSFHSFRINSKIIQSH